MADDHAQTVQVCIDRLHELGAKRATQTVDQKVAKPSEPDRETMTKTLRPLGANVDDLKGTS